MPAFGSNGYGINAHFSDGDVTTRVELPQTVSLAGAYEGDSWEVLGDWTWTGWSSIQDLTVRRADDSVLSRVPLNFQDTWRAGLGVNHRINDAWLVRFGRALREPFLLYPSSGAGPPDGLAWRFAMDTRLCRILPALLVLSALPTLGRAQDLRSYDPKAAADGNELFREHCAACHGAGGKGDGPIAGQLHYAPPDLTSLGQRTRDGFSFEQTRRIIDGRRPVKGHGGPEMPVWGDVFKTRTGGFSERLAVKKTTSLVNYLASIQER